MHITSNTLSSQTVLFKFCSNCCFRYTFFEFFLKILKFKITSLKTFSYSTSTGWLTILFSKSTLCKKKINFFFKIIFEYLLVMFLWLIQRRHVPQLLLVYKLLIHGLKSLCNVLCAGL